MTLNKNLTYLQLLSFAFSNYIVWEDFLKKVELYCNNYYSEKLHLTTTSTHVSSVKEVECKTLDKLNKQL